MMRTCPPYQLLTTLFSPWTSREKIRALCRSIGSGRKGWEPMVNLAIQQWCTPFWFAAFDRHGCVDLLPAQLAAMLKTQYLTNDLRGKVMRRELQKILARFQEQDIGTILLKGAATFTDDLYSSPAARTMLDMDLLVRKERIETARNILLQLGYEEIHDEGKELNGLPTDARHAHINGYRKPKTPVIVELHYAILLSIVIPTLYLPDLI